MDIKVNRGVLRFVKMNHITEKNLNVNKEAPQSFSSKYQREGCPCVLLKKGTLTVEAAFCATAFFLAFFSLLYLFELVFIQSRMEMTLARAVARYQTYGTKAGTIEMLYKEKAVIRWDDERAWLMKVMEQKNLYTLQNMEEFIINSRNVYIFTLVFKVFYIKMYIKKEMLPVENMVSVKVVAVMWN